MERAGVREQSHRAVFRTAVQVAAVCYRRRRGGIEFLLVRTSSGRWIFPKGHVQELLSDGEAALREAWEEAGVIGSIHRECFHTFWYFKGSRDSTGEEPAVLMKAYLVEVLEQREPQEEDRVPTWFAAGEARRRLAQDRDLRARSPLLATVARAVATLSGSRTPSRTALADAPHARSTDPVT